MNITKLILAACGFGLAGVGEANAVLIDHFNVPAGGQIVPITGGIVGTTASSVASPLAGVLGGSRQIVATVQAFTESGNSTVASANDPGTAPDYYNLATDLNVDSVGKIIWDASGAGLGANFSGGGSFVLSGVDNDHHTLYTLVVTTSGGGTSSLALLNPEFNLTDLVFPAAAFLGGADWSDIDSITLIVDTPRAGDAKIHALDFVVPDAGFSMILLGGGLLGLATLRRKLQVA